MGLILWAFGELIAAVAGRLFKDQENDEIEASARQTTLRERFANRNSKRS